MMSRKVFPEHLCGEPSDGTGGIDQHGKMGNMNIIVRYSWVGRCVKQRSFFAVKNFYFQQYIQILPAEMSIYTNHSDYTKRILKRVSSGNKIGEKGLDSYVFQSGLPYIQM